MGMLPALIFQRLVSKTKCLTVGLYARRALRLALLRLRNRLERDAESNKPPGKKDGPSSRQPSPALVALLLGAAMVSNDKERAAAVDASDAAATDDTLRGVMDDLTPPG